jgi:tetratricopeptide (TPR) repeat protein
VQTLDLLTALLDQSLLQRHEDANGDARFVMLETIREFAMERLAGSDDEVPARDLHAAHFLDLAEAGEAGLTGPDQAVWMARLETEYGNLRAALAWAVERGDASSSQRFGSALWRFWAASGRLREGRDWLDRALALGQDQGSAERARALLRRGNVAVELADYPTAQIMYDESLSIYRALDDEMSACIALNGLGIVHWSQGSYADARAAHETTLRLWKSREWDSGVALALQNLGNIAVAERDYAGAREAFDTSLSIRLQQGDEGGAAYARTWRGRLDRIVGQVEESREYLTQALTRFRHLDDRMGIAFTLNELGNLAHDQGDDQAALAYHLEALDEMEAAGEIQGLVECLEGIGAVAFTQRKTELGVTLCTAAAAWRRRHNVPLIPDLRSAFERSVNQARCSLPDASFRRAHDAGEALTIDEARDLAKSWAG